MLFFTVAIMLDIGTVDRYLYVFLVYTYIQFSKNELLGHINANLLLIDRQT